MGKSSQLKIGKPQDETRASLLIPEPVASRLARTSVVRSPSTIALVSSAPISQRWVGFQSSALATAARSSSALMPFHACAFAPRATTCSTTSSRTVLGLHVVRNTAAPRSSNPSKSRTTLCSRWAESARRTSSSCGIASICHSVSGICRRIHSRRRASIGSESKDEARSDRDVLLAVNLEGNGVRAHVAMERA